MFARVAPFARARVRAERSTAAEHEQKTRQPPGRVARHPASASLVYATSAFAADLDRQGALVDGNHLLGPAARRRDREGAHVRVRVQHCAAVRELLHAGAKGALIEVKPRLLSEREGNAELQVALDELQRVD